MIVRRAERRAIVQRHSENGDRLTLDADVVHRRDDGLVRDMVPGIDVDYLANEVADRHWVTTVGDGD